MKEILIGLFIAIIGGIVVVNYEQKAFGKGKEKNESNANDYQQQINNQREEALKQKQRQIDEENTRREAELRQKEADLQEAKRIKDEEYIRRQNEIEAQANNIQSVSNTASYDSEYIGVWERTEGTHSGGSYKITVTGENNQLVFTYLSGKVQKFDMPRKGEKIMYADKGSTWGTPYTMVFAIEGDQLIYSAISSGGGQNGTITYKRIR